MAFLINFIGSIPSMMKVQAAPPDRRHMHWAGFPGEEYVHRLNGDNAAAFIRNNRAVLVFFYSNSCQHCQDLIPEYSEAAKMINQYDPSIKLAALDVIRYRYAQKQFHLSGVPTINFYMDGKFVVEYTMKRRAAEIIAFARRYVS